MLNANKGQVAEFFGVSLPAVTAWIRRECPVIKRGAKNEPYEFDLYEVAEWYFTRYKKPSTSDQLSPRERRDWYESELKKLELKKRKREVIPAIEVEETVLRAISAVAQGLTILFYYPAG